MASLLPETFPHTVRLFPGQPVREEDLVHNAVRCLNELGSGGVRQQGVCGAHASTVDATLGRFHCGARRMCTEQPTADGRVVLNDLLGGFDPYRVECSGFTPLVERLLLGAGGCVTAASHQAAGVQRC